jgi:hypothetical protein
MDAMHFLQSKDSIERLTMQAVAFRASQLADKQDQQRARMIRNEVLRGLSGKS